MLFVLMKTFDWIHFKGVFKWLHSNSILMHRLLVQISSHTGFHMILLILLKFLICPQWLQGKPLFLTQMSHWLTIFNKFIPFIWLFISQIFILFEFFLLAQGNLMWNTPKQTKRMFTKMWQSLSTKMTYGKCSIYCSLFNFKLTSSVIFRKKLCNKMMKLQ